MSWLGRANDELMQRADRAFTFVPIDQRSDVEMATEVIVARLSRPHVKHLCGNAGKRMFSGIVTSHEL
jgi:uncharacterized protein YceH (UPF0502 family)